MPTPRHLDQFYTRPEIAKSCWARVEAFLALHPKTPSIWIEPSAGTGVFLDLLPEPKLGLDLDPQRDDILRADFLSYDVSKFDHMIVIGNPPFGKNASLALRFLNYAAEAQLVGFILPRTAEKVSWQRRVDPHLWLVDQMVLPQRSFVFKDHWYDVPCVFQLWERRPQKRGLHHTALEHPDFAFVSKEQGQRAFQRVGVQAGRISSNFAHKAPASHYFLQQLHPQRDVFSILETIDWSPIKRRTAGNPSISKRELVLAYSQALSALTPTPASQDQ